MTKDQDPVAVLSRVLDSTAKIIDALEDAESLGGIAGLRERLRQSTFEKLVGQLPRSSRRAWWSACEPRQGLAEAASPTGEQARPEIVGTKSS